jgi:hypothetical protein
MGGATWGQVEPIQVGTINWELENGYLGKSMNYKNRRENEQNNEHDKIIQYFPRHFQTKTFFRLAQPRSGRFTRLISRNPRPGYLRDPGSMLWSQFSAIFANFLRKNWLFSQNHNLALFRVNNAIFCNIYKIYTSPRSPVYFPRGERQSFVQFFKLRKFVTSIPMWRI